MDHSHAALHVLEFHMWDFFYPMSARSSSLLTVDSDYRFCVCLSMVMHIHERVFQRDAKAAELMTWETMLWGMAPEHKADIIWSVFTHSKVSLQTAGAIKLQRSQNCIYANLISFWDVFKMGRIVQKQHTCIPNAKASHLLGCTSFVKSVSF